jgi:hypothetical protein
MKDVMRFLSWLHEHGDPCEAFDTMVLVREWLRSEGRTDEAEALEVPDVQH